MSARAFLATIVSGSFGDGLRLAYRSGSDGSCAGKTPEADRWLSDAAAIRSSIIDKLYSADDAAFYDLDAEDHFVRVRGDVISRVLGEHIVDEKLFQIIYERQIHNPKAFWAPYPLASVALDDPAFVRPIPRNSWGELHKRLPRYARHGGWNTIANPPISPI